MSSWRQVGLNYINYSSIAAKVVRKVLKPEFVTDASKRPTANIKLTPWVDGKAQKNVVQPDA